MSDLLQPRYDQVLPSDIEPALKQHYLRVGYWASVSYFDYHFGMMLDALQSSGVEQDTIVLVSGDVSRHSYRCFLSFSLLSTIMLIVDHF